MKMSKKIISSVIILVLTLTLVFPCFSVNTSAADTSSYMPLSASTASNVVNINVAGENNYSLFNSGRTGSTSGSSSYPDTYDNGGYDIYASMGSYSEIIQLGLPFTMKTTTSEQVRVNVYAYDVDEIGNWGSCNERDYIYLVDETTGERTKLEGYLSGQDSTWNNTTLSFAPELLELNHTYHLELDVDCTCGCSNAWVVYIRAVSILINGDMGDDPTIQKPQKGIENADLSASISSTGLVTVNLSANAYAEEYYYLEYKAVCFSNSSQYGGTQGSAFIPTYTTEITSSFYLESGALSGTYEITLFFKDSYGNVISTRSVTASYGFSAVSYNSNGGSQNVPTDRSTYSNGDTVTVLFDHIPSKYGYDFIGWATKSDATEPDFPLSETSQSFTIGSSDVTLYAVWAHVHVPGEWIYDVEPSCYTGGHRHNYCALCEELLVDEDVGPIGHDFVVISETSASCTQDGLIVFECDRDGCDHTKEQVLIASGHSFGDDNYCDNCGFELVSHNHTYSENTVAPTCTQVGYTVYTCSCGYQYRGNFVDQKGHDFDEGGILEYPSCTIEGVMRYHCANCEAYYDVAIPATHDWTETVTKEANCTEDGNIHRECNVCGTAEDEVIPAYHVWDEGIVNSEPDCTTPGSKTCTCTVCGTVEDLEIDVLGHEFRDGFCVLCGATIPEVINPDSDHPEYGMYFEIDDIISNYGPAFINEYGVLLDYNKDANIKKVAVYLTQEGTMWRRCIAVVGDNISYATYVPYLSYNEEIHYSGLNSDWINIFRLSENSDGIWCYSNYVTIGVNLEDADGNLLLSLYDIGEAGAKTRIFDDLDAMIEWLKDEDGCIYHTPGSWIIDNYPTTMSAGQKHNECIDCGATVETKIIPPVAVMDIDNIVAKSGSTVSVDINIRNNPGIIGAALTIEFDYALTLVSASAGSAWSSLNITYPGVYENYCTFVWDGTSDDTSNGTVITLTFELPEDAYSGSVYSIYAYYDDGDIINSDLDPVEIEINYGSISVDNVSLGDVNLDGVTDLEDLIYLRRYIAGGYNVSVDNVQSDMDGNGKIDISDVILLRQYLLEK